MAKKKRKILKIILISIAALAVILIFVSILFNSYLKKTIEASLNETLNAKVSIDKARYRVFSSIIEIHGLKILGVSEFDDEVLLSVDKASIKLKDYNKKENKIILKQFTLESPNINNITLESGLNSWKECIKKQSADTSINQLKDMTLFCENIVINNAKFHNENRKTKKSQSLHDVYIELSIWKDEDMIGGDYKFRSVFDLKENNLNAMSLSINASGGIFLENSEFRSYSKLEINNKPFNLDVIYNYDSILNKPSNLRFNADLAYWNFGQNVKSKGNLDLKIEVDGIFNDSISPSVKLDLFTADLAFINKQTKDSAYCDFGLELDYNINDNMLIGINSYDFNAILLDDSISGNFQIEFNDTECIANSDISGELDLSNLKKIFSDSDINFGGIFALNSDLNGIIDAKSNTLNGNFKCDYIGYDESNYFNLELSPSQLRNNLRIDNKYISVKNGINIPDIESIYRETTTEFICYTNIKKISIPISSNSSYEIPQGFNNETPNITFPKITATQYKLTIDSLIVGDILFSEINADIAYTPDKIGIQNLDLFIGENSITSFIYLKKNNDESIELTSKLETFDFDLSYFANDSKEIAGIINIQSYNHFFSINDTILSDKNFGKNNIFLTNFRLKDKILQDYKIDEDYIKIDSLDLNIDVNKNMLVLSPTEFNINEIELAGQAHMDINSGNIMLETFLNVPDKYLSTEVKLLLSLFTESVEDKLNRRRTKGENIYKLKITGTPRNLSYKIYKY